MELRAGTFFRRFRVFAPMTLDEKVRFGMMAIGGASLVFAALGLHVSPLDAMSGAGS
jgi:hypothetical protein